MIRDVLQSIEQIEIFPIIGLMFFLAAAALVAVWVWRLSKSEVERISRLPLDDPGPQAADGTDRGSD
jgi:hypothetical protein